MILLGILQVVMLGYVLVDIRHRGFGAHALFSLASLLFVCFGFLYLSLKSGTADVTPLVVCTLGAFVFIATGLVFGGSRWRTRLTARSTAPVFRTEGIAVVGVGIILVSLSYFVLLGTIPVLSGLGRLEGSAVNTARVSRDVYINSDARYIPLQGLFEAVRYFGLPVAFIYGLYLRRFGHRTGGTLLAVASVLVAIATAQRWPLVYFIVSCAMIPWVRSAWRPKQLWTLGASWFLGFVGLTMVLGREATTAVGAFGRFVELSGQFLERVFVDQMRVPFASYFSHSPLLEGQNGGTWVQSLLSYAPGVGASYPVDFYRTVTGDSTGYTAPPDAYTEAFINFGIPGVLIFSVVWSMLLSGFDSWRQRTDPAGSDVEMGVLAVCLGFSVFTGVTFVFGAIIVTLMIRIAGRLFGTRSNEPLRKCVGVAR